MFVRLVLNQDNSGMPQPILDGATVKVFRVNSNGFPIPKDKIAISSLLTACLFVKDGDAEYTSC